jgi:hypothetical protein
VARRRWIYVNGVAYEEGVDVVPENPLETRPHNRVIGDLHYDGLRATDGTDISTRTKHREYMKRHNLTTMDDFNGSFNAALKRKAEYSQEGKHGAVKRADIERAIHTLQQQRRK